jgi:hypothetical protein
MADCKTGLHDFFSLVFHANTLWSAGPIMDHDFRVQSQRHQRYRAEIGDPDGFSDAPLFFLYQDDTRQAHLGFVGMFTDSKMSGSFPI